LSKVTEREDHALLSDIASPEQVRMDDSQARPGKLPWVRLRNGQDQYEAFILWSQITRGSEHVDEVDLLLLLLIFAFISRSRSR